MASNYPSTSKPKKGIGKDFGFQSDPAPRKPGPRKNVNPKPIKTKPMKRAK